MFGLSTPGLLPGFKKVHNQQFPKPLSSGEGTTYGFKDVRTKNGASKGQNGFRVWGLGFSVQGLEFRV